MDLGNPGSQEGEIAMKTSIFKATVNTPYGLFMVAVDSTAHDAKSDIKSAILSDLPSHVGQVQVSEVKKSSRRIIATMDELKRCNSSNGQWGWIKKL